MRLFTCIVGTNHQRSKTSNSTKNTGTYRRNFYPNDNIWLTDGYGDYVRHYLRAMAAMPELAPSGEEHILSSSSIIQEADYAPFGDFWFGDDLGKLDRATVKIFYRAFDNAGVEKIKLLKKPSAVMVGKNELHELKELSAEGFTWQPLKTGGVLTVKRENGKKVIIVE